MPPTLYFAYGSNLWLHQMSVRCPSSPYLGIAKLSHWRWIICNRGYANIVHSSADEVWGMVYALSLADEERLDMIEGVATGSYGKQMLTIELRKEVEGKNGDVKQPGQEVLAEEVVALGYVSERWVDEARPKEEYVHRMNMGVCDALEKGMPVAYVEKYIRPFIPEESKEERESKAEVKLWGLSQTSKRSGAGPPS